MAVKELSRGFIGDILYKVMHETASNTQYAIVAYSVDQGLETITIPAQFKGVNITSIEAGAFAQMPRLEKVIIEQRSCFSVQPSAFSNCPQLSEFISFAQCLDVSKKAFSDCRNLKKFWTTSLCNFIGNNIFENCISLNEVVGEIAEMRTGSLIGCPNLKKLIFADNIKIPQDALSHCSVESLVFYGTAVFENQIIPDTLRDTLIYCRKYSPLIELAYDGFRIEAW